MPLAREKLKLQEEASECAGAEMLRCGVQRAHIREADVSIGYFDAIIAGVIVVVVVVLVVAVVDEVVLVILYVIMPVIIVCASSSRHNGIRYISRRTAYGVV